MIKRRDFLVVGAASAVLAACGQSAEAKQTIEVYKRATCGCCGKWVEYMEDHGYLVETHTVSDLDAVKRKFRIPRSMVSCHTAIVGDYVVEGHVPVEVVDRLLSERASIDGIALPRMPAGSPGMPGSKRGTWTIYSLKQGKYGVHETI